MTRVPGARPRMRAGWPFERVVVAHGDVSERGGREELARGYAWLPGGDAVAES